MSDAQASPKRCFVISPIGEAGSEVRFHADMVLESIIKPALSECSVERADDLGAPEMISNKIIEAITTYELAVADLTFHNPNVFYELGLRHMSEKPVIHICADGTKLPFDTAGVSTIFYNVADIHSHRSAASKISEYARKALAPDYKVSNPVTQARSSIRIAGSSDSNEMMIASLLQRVGALESKLADSHTKLADGPKLEPTNYLLRWLAENDQKKLS